MIISHEHRFIFLKTRKTAGTSVEIALSDHLGPRDVVTSMGAADETTRRERGGRTTQNDRLPWRQQSPRDIARLVVRGRPATAWNHMPADAVAALAGRRAWQSYYKFAIVRNPWDAAVSHWFFKTRKLPTRPTLGQFLASPAIEALRRNWQVLTIDDVVVADRILGYESLEQDLEQVRTRIGISTPLDLPRAKAAIRTGSRDYHEFYADEDAAKVATLFAREIALFDYRY